MTPTQQQAKRDAEIDAAMALAEWFARRSIGIRPFSEAEMRTAPYWAAWHVGHGHESGPFLDRMLVTIHNFPRSVFPFVDSIGEFGGHDKGRWRHNGHAPYVLA